MDNRAWIRTFTGKEFNIIEPTVDMVCIEDIAHSLSMLCRFTGHVKYFYSVAQHSYLGSQRIRPDLALEFLLHDATESYLNDMSRPLKHCTDAGVAYQKIENRIANVIKQKFNLPMIVDPAIHQMDDEMLLAEKAQLMPKGGSAWSLVITDKVADVKIHKMSPELVETLFLECFYILSGKYGRKLQWV